MFPCGVPHLNILCLHKNMMGAEADDSITQSQKMLPRAPEQNWSFALLQHSHLML